MSENKDDVSLAIVGGILFLLLVVFLTAVVVGTWKAVLS